MSELGGAGARESIAAFVEAVRRAVYPTTHVAQCEQLAAALRRAAKRGVDPSYELAAEFDLALIEGMRALNEVTRLLSTIRERVDLAKIKEEREARRIDWAPTIAARARKVPAGLRRGDLRRRLEATLKRMTPEERARVFSTVSDYWTR